MRTARSVMVLLLIGLCLALALWWQPIMVHLSQETGTSNSASRAYDFFSGFGSDLGEATIVVGIVAAFRHHNCHVKRCLRLGKPVEGTPYLACPRHHPAHAGEKRGISHETLLDAFKARRR